jgi:hypothetical protein
MLAFQIDQNRAIHAALTEGKVIHPKDVRCRTRVTGSTPHDTEQRIGAEGHVQGSTRTRTSLPSSRKGEGLEGCSQANRSSGCNRHERRQPFRKGPLAAVWSTTAKASDLKVQVHRVFTHGQITR